MIAEKHLNVKHTLSGAHLPEIDKFRLPKLTEVAGRRASVEFFAGLGCQFVLLAQGDKTPLQRNWQHNPQPPQRAITHTGNLGIPTGKHSNNIVFLDLDNNAREFLATFPQLQNSLIVWRDDAPNRLKIAVQLSDRLPRSANYRRNPNQKQPDMELLSTGRQAFVIGIHPSGAVMRNNGKQPVTMTLGDLSAIWRKWTGQELPDPTTTKNRTVTANRERLRNAQPAHSDNALANRVKGLWDVLGVFERHSVSGEHREEGAGQVRILGNGGLLVDTVGDVWYQFSSETGGDCIAAWAWCTRGNASMTPAQFVAVCREMLEAKGEQLDAEPKQDWGRLMEFYAQPTAYPHGRNNTFDRGAMLAVLGRMAKLNRTAIKMSTRELGEMAGCGHKTAWKALGRLIDYGLLERANLPSWHAHAVYEDRDGHLINQFDAYGYALTDDAISAVHQVSELTTVQSTRMLELRSVVDSDTSLDTHTMREYADNDAMQWGAKIAETEVRIGRAGLDILAALENCNDLATAELAEATGRSRSGLLPVLRSLVDLGILEQYTEERRHYWYLRDNWRDILQCYINSLTTFCRTIKRQIRHLQERLHRAGCALGIADSGALRARLCEMLERWQRKLQLLRDELSRLRGFRPNVVHA